MSRQFSDVVTILDAQSATGTGITFDVREYQHVTLTLATASNANLTVKFQGALASEPDFSASRSVSNHWDYVAVYDLEDASIIDGDTGIAPAGTDDFRNLLLNVDGIDFITATVTARSAGSVTIKARGYTND